MDTMYALLFIITERDRKYDYKEHLELAMAVATAVSPIIITRRQQKKAEIAQQLRTLLFDDGLFMLYYNLIVICGQKNSSSNIQ